jgi:hypothetical protein
MTGVGGRGDSIAWGRRIGTALGLLVAIPLGLLLALPTAAGPGPAGQWDLLRGVWAWILGPMAGNYAGEAIAEWWTTTPGGQSRIAWTALRWGVGGVFFAALLSTPALLSLSPLAGGFTAPLTHALPILVFLPVILATMGAAHARAASRLDEAREQDAIRRHLDARRDELERAVEAKFGPLDEGLRERLRASTHEQIAEVERRLPDAARVEDLDP